MNKSLIALFFIFMPLSTVAQSQWEKPLTPKEQIEQAKKEQEAAKKALKVALKKAKKAEKIAKKSNATTFEEGKDTKLKSTIKGNKSDNIKKSVDQKYLKENAVPEEDGKVVFTLDLEVPGKRAQQIYDSTYVFLDQLSREENQKESSIVLFNKKEHIIAAKYSEWMEFSRNFLSLDRTEFNYTIIATCSDNKLHMTLERITYNYEEGRSTGFKIGAEKWITDKYAVNKRKTKLLAGSAKFRRKTIDRKDQIFNDITKKLTR